MVEPNEQRHLDLGGSIHYRSPVTAILVEADPSGQGDRATGVRLADGTEHRGDIVVSAADGRTTTFDMLGGKYLSDDIAGYYDGPPVFPSLVLVSLGVDRSFGGLPVSVAGEIFPLDEPITIGGQNAHWLGVHSLSFAPEAAPAGKTLLRVMFGADYEYWSDLREQDRKRYWAEKAQIADQMIAQLDRRFPGLAPQVEMRDVATPATFGRYTGNWKGSMMGWLLMAATMGIHMSKTLPGLANFYQVGQWVLDTGLPGAVTSGRHIVQIICSGDGKPFVTTVPCCLDVSGPSLGSNRGRVAAADGTEAARIPLWTAALREGAPDRRPAGVRRRRPGSGVPDRGGAPWRAPPAVAWCTIANRLWRRIRWATGRVPMDGRPTQWVSTLLRSRSGSSPRPRQWCRESFQAHQGGYRP